MQIDCVACGRGSIAISGDINRKWGDSRSWGYCKGGDVASGRPVDCDKA